MLILHLVGEQFSFNFGFFFMHFRAFLVVVKAVRIPWVLLVAFAEDQAMFWIQINDRAKVRYVDRQSDGRTDGQRDGLTD